MVIAMDSANIENDSPGVNIMPPIVFYGCLILGGVAEYFIPSHIPLLPKVARIILGIALGAVGFTFMMIAHETFKHRGTNVPTNLPATAFVIQGAYGKSRNPMYVGGSAFFLGIGLTIGSLWMLTAYIPLGLYLALFVIPREEAYMQRTFGDEYRKYCLKVRRWL